MFLRLLTIETRKLFKHPLLWLETGALAVLFGIYYAARLGLARGQNAPGPETDLQAGLEFFNFFSVFFIATTTAFISAYDIPERGIQMWLARGVPRPLLILSRLVVALGAALLLISAAMLLLRGEAALARSIFTGGVGAANTAEIPGNILRLFWGAVPYLALTVLLASLSRSAPFAAGGTVVFRTVLENLLNSQSARFASLMRFSPAHLALALQTKILSPAQTAPGEAYLNEPQAILAIGVLLVLASLLSLAIFARQDWGG